MTPNISVIITTRNRAGHLRETLSSFQQLIVPRGMVAELLVVDNGSEDETSVVVQEVEFAQISKRYLREAVRGQSNARNTGMAHSRGEVILFTDDDVRVSVTWLESMWSAIRRGSADAVAGEVELAGHLTRPWMKPYHLGYLAAASPNGEVDSMTGANMAFRRDVLEKVPGFDPEVGPGRLGYGDDTLFSWQIKAAGLRLVGNGAGKVQHHFEESRLARGAWLMAAAARGRSKAYLAHHWLHSEVKMPYWRGIRAGIVLLRWRLKNRELLRATEGCCQEELQMVRSVHYFDQLRREVRRPRRYAKQGLMASA